MRKGSPVPENLILNGENRKMDNVEKSIIVQIMKLIIMKLPSASRYFLCLRLRYSQHLVFKNVFASLYFKYQGSH
jgi:hypothetical protein